MIRKRFLFVVLGLCLAICSAGSAVQADPYDAVESVVADSGVFPEGTSVVDITIVGGSIIVELSLEAIPPDFCDTMSDSMVKAIVDAVSPFKELTDIEVQVGGQPLWAYLTRSEQTYEGDVPSVSPVVRRLAMGAQNPLSEPSVAPISTELAGKLVVLHPSHGSYVYGTPPSVWYRAMRTFCGPNPVTNSPYAPYSYQPSDYYYWTKGLGWPMYYEDDMSPETIRFLYAYCQSGGAATYCSRNLDKNAGDFPATTYGYPAPTFPLPKWQTATKYALQDRGGIPSTVWNTTDVTGESNIDLRARAYYTNWLMQTLGYSYTNTVSFSLHSNAATTGTPIQSQARGTETYWYATQYPTEQAQSQAFCTAVENGVISAIRTQYDGYWAEPIYDSANSTITPPEWTVAYGTYRGYVQDGGTNYRWQDRGVKTTNFGEIRECKCPAQLMELLFHDDWKFYPDQAFHQDPIFRSTVAWGMYTGICNFFGVTPKARLAATVESVSFPAVVQPGETFTGTVTMRNLGQAWCWGMKQVGTVYGPYNVWVLKGTNADQFGGAGVKVQLANDGYYYPGDTATFTVSLTAPATGGYYNTSWRMRKDDGKGGDFGSTATAVIGVDAPWFTATQNAANVKTGSSAATAPVTLRGDVLITVMPSPAIGFGANDPVQISVDGVATGAVTESGGNYVCTATVDGATANGAHQITVTVTEADDSVTVLNDWIYVNKNEINGTVTLPGFVGASRDVAFSIDGAAPITRSLSFAGGVAGYKLVNLPDTVSTLSAKTAWTLRQNKAASLVDAVDFVLAGGDIDGGNSVNIADYNLLKSSWFQAAPAADISGDGVVNGADYNIMKANWFTAGDPQ